MTPQVHNFDDMASPCSFAHFGFILDEIVAIKAIDMKGVKDAISREMLDCEIEALRTIKHHNVLKCFDVIRETSHCYIVT